MANVDAALVEQGRGRPKQDDLRGVPALALEALAEDTCARLAGASGKSPQILERLRITGGVDLPSDA